MPRSKAITTRKSTRSLNQKLDIKIDANIVNFFRSHPKVIESKLDPEFVAAFAFAFDEIIEPYPIPIEFVVKWTNYSTVEKMMEFLNEKYTENEDFVKNVCTTQLVQIAEVAKKKPGRPKLHYHLTVDCFKEILMDSQTETGKVTKRYFLLMEKLSKEYIKKVAEQRREAERLQIEAANKRAAEAEQAAILLAKENKKLKKQIKKEEKQIVYIITTNSQQRDNKYKVGITNDMDRRLCTFETSVPDSFIKIKTYEVEDNKFVEYIAHRILDEFRPKGTKKEWFQCDSEHIIATVEKTIQFLDECYLRNQNYLNKKANNDSSTDSEENTTIDNEENTTDESDNIPDSPTEELMQKIQEFAVKEQEIENNTTDEEIPKVLNDASAEQIKITTEEYIRRFPIKPGQYSSKYYEQYSVYWSENKLGKPLSKQKITEEYIKCGYQQVKDFKGIRWVLPAVEPAA